MQLPANLKTTGAITTPSNAVAGVPTSTQLVAAPGAGFRIRVWQIVFGSVENLGPATIRGFINVAGGFPEANWLTPNGTVILPFPGGLVCVANTALSASIVASVAGPLNARTTAYYTVGAV